MFKLAKKYTGLDDLFYTKDRNHMTSNEEIEKRLDELAPIYKDWEYGLYKFPVSDIDRNYVQSDCRDAVELMREASTGYYLASFDTTIMLSSMAVERLLQAILLVNRKGFQKCKKGERISEEIEIEINSPNPTLKEGGIIKFYYGHRIDSKGKKRNDLAQFRQENNEWYYFEIPSLSASLGKITQEEAPTCLLCDKN